MPEENDAQIENGTTPDDHTSSFQEFDEAMDKEMHASLSAEGIGPLADEEETIPDINEEDLQNLLAEAQVLGDAEELPSPPIEPTHNDKEQELIAGKPPASENVDPFGVGVYTSSLDELPDIGAVRHHELPAPRSIQTTLEDKEDAPSKRKTTPLPIVQPHGMEEGEEMVYRAAHKSKISKDARKRRRELYKRRSNRRSRHRIGRTLLVITVIVVAAYNITLYRLGPRPLINAAHQAHAAEEYAKAAGAYQAIIAYKPLPKLDIFKSFRMPGQEIEDAYYYRASCLEKCGNYAEAKEAYKKYLLHYPNQKSKSTWAMYESALIEVELGDSKTAIEQLRGIIQDFPNEAVIVQASAQIAKLEGKDSDKAPEEEEKEKSDANATK
jgi:TolA-binding protein